MKTELTFEIKAQPDDESCGPTCLHSLYCYYGDDIPLKKVVTEVQKAEYGGTLIEILACHALKRGYDATIYTWHVQMFDPTWFAEDGDLHDPVGVRDLLSLQLDAKRGTPRLATATRAYREFLALGGKLRMEDLTPQLIGRYIAEKTPIITGLSSTFLYREQRSITPTQEDDVKGHPQGHFVMLVGYDSSKHEVTVADPLDENPPFHTNRYRLPMTRLVNAILLGILTHDANLLIVKPKLGADAFETKPATKRVRKRRTPAKPSPADESKRKS
jgi:hypothetical protein